MDTCRFCGAELTQSFCDLGMSPLSNAYLTKEQLSQSERFYPLHAYVCNECWLVQLPEHESPEHIFAQDYAYFSSYSDTWLDHARRYTNLMIERFGLGRYSQVVEIASNDGYLLQYFKEREIPVLGIEPAANVAEVAIRKGINTVTKFFGRRTAEDLVNVGVRADLLLGNNVLAHVPDINDFVAGMKLLLKPGGVVTMEFPHLLRLIQGNQFDTIYHEHYSYLSFCTVESVFARHGLRLFDVEELATHGGSLRIYACHEQEYEMRLCPAVSDLRKQEKLSGLNSMAAYVAFAESVKETKFQLLEFLIKAKRQGKRVWGYGAPAKGNTLLNYCGVRTDLIECSVDRNPYKQNRFLPGTRIPILPPESILESKPDYLLILPWNLKDEIMGQMSHIRTWGGQFVVPIPQVRVVA
jgi:2-polyprenyl-3-methyl-5-hydroxy-6-metoxy-1,4-benzoquinol methylase